MFVKVIRVRNKEYVNIVKSYWDKESKSCKHKVVQNLGLLSKLEENDPNFLENLRNEFKKYSKDKEEKEVLLGRMLGTFKDVLSDDNVDGEYDIRDENKIHNKYQNELEVLNYGNLILNNVYRKLDLDKYFEKSKSMKRIKYDLNNIVQNLVAMRFLKPCSKSKTFNIFNEYTIKNDDTLKSIYRSLEILCDERLDIIEHINKKLAELFDRNLKETFYDVTTVYFESIEKNDLLDYGFSKDAKINNVQVVLGMMIDAYGIPIAYKLFARNTCDFKTFIPFIKEVKEKLGIENITVIADRGLNSGPNLLELKKDGFEFIMSHKIKGNKNLVPGIIDLATYEQAAEGFYVKKAPLTKKIKDELGLDNSLDGNLILSFSEKRRKKDQSDRERLIKKAKSCVEKNGSKAMSELKKGGKKYVNYSVGEISLNEEKIIDDARWDGFYGIYTSNKNLSIETVIRTYSNLWKIEESFRILKTTFETRPVYLSKEKTIEGHFMICYLALVIERFIEFSLSSLANNSLTTDRIVDALRKVKIVLIESLDKKEKYFLRVREPEDYTNLRESLGYQIIPKWGKVDELGPVLLESK